MARKKTTKAGTSKGADTKKKGSRSGSTAKKGTAHKAGASKKKTGSDAADTPKKAAPKKRSGGAASIAEQLVEDPEGTQRVADFADQLLDERSTTATQAARVLSEVIARKPEMVVGHVDKFVKGLRSKQKRVVQTCAEALPAIAKVAPARVARHLDTLKGSFDDTNEVGRDGLVRTFANLCSASVAYQKRLEPVLTKALHHAQGKTLLAWTEAVLPALKGEPHARARAVVEGRLHKIPRSQAQPIADFLGVKLRPNIR